jgi:hypothetical protein
LFALLPFVAHVGSMPPPLTLIHANWALTVEPGFVNTMHIICDALHMEFIMLCSNHEPFW